MFDSSPKPRSDDPNTPQISSLVYFEEKATFAGALIGAILYGIVIVLCFQCVAALVSPVNRKRGDIKWGLVAHTAVMFLFVTVYITITLYVLSTSYIDNREFPGVNGLLPPGPLGYQYFTYANAINVVPTLMFLLNNWLADGLLLYRCYVVYTMNYLVIAFPCLMYLASLATGITFICKVSRPTSTTHISANLKTIGLPHNSISVSLNVLLTLMVVVRLMLHNKEIRKAMGTSTTNGGLYKAIVTMLVQSCALYTVNFVLFIGLWAVNNPIANTFFPILIQTQVIAPFLIILRVANRSTSTSETIVPGAISSIRFKAPADNETFPNRYPTELRDTFRETPSDLGV